MSEESLANMFDSLSPSDKKELKEEQGEQESSKQKDEEIHISDKHQEENHIDKLFKEREKKKKPTKKPEGFLMNINYLKAVNLLAKKYGYGYKQAFANEAFKNQLRIELNKEENKKIKKKIKEQGIDI